MMHRFKSISCFEFQGNDFVYSNVLYRILVGLMLLTILLFTRLVQADLLLEVTQGNDELTKVAVSPFYWSGKSLLPEDIASIISNDLKLSGLFNPIPRERMLSSPSNPSQVNYRDWRVLGASYLVTGQVHKSGNGYTIDYQLLNIFSQKQVIRGKVTGYSTQLRALAHSISDEVYHKITGLKGDASSRLLYVTAEKVKPARTIKKGNKQTVVPPVFIYKLKYADADGKRVRTVFQSSEPLLSLSWSPDGTKVAYVSFESGRSAIYIQELATGKRRKVVDYDGVNSSPAWSPDGQKLAFMSSKGGNNDIYILDLPNNKFNRVTSLFSIDTEPAWMPDGKSIIFTSNRGGSVQIYKLPLTIEKNGGIEPDGKPKRLTFNGSFNARAKVFPNGKEIVMVHKGSRTADFNIAVQNLATGNIRLLTQSKLEDSPSISPNGRRVVYAAPGKIHGELGVVSVDGRVKYRLPSASGSVREPVWGPPPAQN